MCMFIVQISLVNWTTSPMLLEHILLQSNLSCEEFSAFSAARANLYRAYNSTLFVPPGPISIKWIETVWDEKFARHFHPWPAVGIET